MEEEVLVKTALSYVRHVYCSVTASFRMSPLRFIYSFANRGRFGYEAGESVTKRHFVLIPIAFHYNSIDNVVIATNFYPDVARERPAATVAPRM